MREIKFRAWDKEEEIMFNVGAIAWSHNAFNTSNYVFGTSPHCYENKCQSPKHLNEECKFMQYTGLKDKNGKEIYEGDIVETCDNKKQLVVWHNNGFKLKFTYSRTYQGELYTETAHLEIGDTSSRRWGDEIIGNIYENPELLK
ncbi:YopX family protein [Terrisporobacter glycolicus]|uniref:YopX protein domain-containing protein n=1 Tax=Terrisporobacter glycolicus ATCC 14880 = DSM 1288 TaxID=1121315 RepID=A0ABZ2EXE0_9FIRM|nr:YopX family protein [Terrisporobacter glycolicus]